MPFYPKDSAIPEPKTPLEERLRVLHTWDMSGPKAFVQQEHGYSAAYADRLEREYKRFVELKLRHQHLDFPVSVPVDPIWHAHMLHTRDYAEFSLAVRGAYLHHVPAMSDEIKKQLLPKYLSRTIAKYTELFGMPDPMFWPTTDTICVQSCIED